MSDSVRVGTRQIYYGWVIVAALSVTETVTWGIVYYGFPVFLRPMEAELGASRVAVTAAFSIGLGVSALAGIRVGRWIDGPRPPRHHDARLVSGVRPDARVGADRECDRALRGVFGLGLRPFLIRLGTLVPFIVLQGAANGMATLARASSLAEIFGSRNYGAIGGAIALGANGARAVGPVGASLLLVALGSCVRVFWALSASLVLAGVLVLLVGWPKSSTE